MYKKEDRERESMKYGDQEESKHRICEHSRERLNLREKDKGSESKPPSSFRTYLVKMVNPRHTKQQKILGTAAITGNTR